MPWWTELCDHFISIGHQNDFSCPRQTDVLGKPGLELLDADRLHTTMVVTGGHFVKRMRLLPRRPARLLLHIWVLLLLQCTEDTRQRDRDTEGRAHALNADRRHVHFLIPGAP